MIEQIINQNTNNGQTEQITKKEMMNTVIILITM